MSHGSHGPLEQLVLLAGIGLENPRSGIAHRTAGCPAGRRVRDLQLVIVSPGTRWCSRCLLAPYLEANMAEAVTPATA